MIKHVLPAVSIVFNVVFGVVEGYDIYSRHADKEERGTARVNYYPVPHEPELAPARELPEEPEYRKPVPTEPVARQLRYRESNPTVYVIEGREKKLTKTASVAMAKPTLPGVRGVCPEQDSSGMYIEADDPDLPKPWLPWCIPVDDPRGGKTCRTIGNTAHICDRAGRVGRNYSKCCNLRVLSVDRNKVVLMDSSTFDVSQYAVYIDDRLIYSN